MMNSDDSNIMFIDGKISKIINKEHLVNLMDSVSLTPDHISMMIEKYFQTLKGTGDVISAELNAVRYINDL